MLRDSSTSLLFCFANSARILSKTGVPPPAVAICISAPAVHVTVVTTLLVAEDGGALVKDGITRQTLAGPDVVFALVKLYPCIAR